MQQIHVNEPYADIGVPCIVTRHLLINEYVNKQYCTDICVHCQALLESAE